MRFSKRTLSTASVVLIAIILAAAAWWRISSDGEGGFLGGLSASSDSAAADLPGVSASDMFPTDVAQQVEGAAVFKDTLWIRVKVRGRAESVRRTEVQPRTQGAIRRLRVRENQVVRRGQILAQLDTVQAAFDLGQRRTALDQAKVRFEDLMISAGDSISDEYRRLARIRTGLEQAESDFEKAKMDYAQTTVRAPFAGRVANLEVVEGQYVGAGTTLLTIVDLTPIKVEGNVLEREIPHISVGRRAEVNFTAFPAEIFEGSVHTMNPIVDQGQTGRVTILLPNPDGRIFPGMTADIVLSTRFYPDRIIVPQAAIRETADGRFHLFVFSGEGREGTVNWRYVTKGEESNLFTEIIPGPETEMVEPGEIVIVQGHRFIKHGAAVLLQASVEDIRGGSTQ